MTAYYNEFDPKTAAWLRELIAQGLITAGDVDERSILDVQPNDLRGYTQCHFFAGIGGWSYALRLAGWSDDRPVWTGSPPCQPFSAAGQGLSRDDPRHLAPHFIRLVRACRPGVLFGEQVASAAVFGKATGGTGKSLAEGVTPEWAWIDDLSERLEAAHYAVGAADIPSAGVGAPHIRQRTFFGAVRLGHAEGGWERSRFADDGRSGRDERSDRAASDVDGLADSIDAGSQGRLRGWQDTQWSDQHGYAGRDGAAIRVANTDGGDTCTERQQCGREHGQQPLDGGGNGGLADAEHPQRGPICQHGEDGRNGPDSGREEAHGFAGTCGEVCERPNAPNSPWGTVDWLFCRDDKWRPVESSILGVADGVPTELVHSGAFVPASSPLAPAAKDSRRVMRLKGYGNAINPVEAAVFIQVFDDSLDTE